MFRSNILGGISYSWAVCKMYNWLKSAYSTAGIYKFTKVVAFEQSSSISPKH